MDKEKLPDLIKINYEDVNYHIYPSTGAITCFHCHKRDHVAKVCPSLQSSLNQDLQSKFHNNQAIDTETPELAKSQASLINTKFTSSTTKLPAMAQQTQIPHETIIKNQLIWWCENHKIFPQIQTAFRPGISCINNLLNMALHIKEALMKKNGILATFLDIRGAFDNVKWETLLEKLASISVFEKNNKIH